MADSCGTESIESSAIESVRQLELTLGPEVHEISRAHTLTSRLSASVARSLAGGSIVFVQEQLPRGRYKSVARCNELRQYPFDRLDSCQQIKINFRPMLAVHLAR